VCSCAFFTFYSCHTYFRYFWVKKHFFAPNLVRAVSPQPLGVFISNFKHRSVGLCSCAFFTFYSCHSYFRCFFLVKNIVFLPQILSALFLHNRLEFSFQILNIGQWGYVVVLFARFIHVTYIYIEE
jgi:hypothetical protein